MKRAILCKAIPSFFVSPCLRRNEIQLPFTMICEVANGFDIFLAILKTAHFYFFPCEVKIITEFGLWLSPLFQTKQGLFKKKNERQNTMSKSINNSSLLLVEAVFSPKCCIELG